MKRLVTIAGALMFATSAMAQSDYGGGWAYVPLDMSSSVTREILNKNVLRQRAGLSPRAQGSGALASPLDGRASSTSPLSAAMSLSGSSPASLATVRTSFVRSKALQRKSEAAILAEVKKRQPGAEVEYGRVLGQQDMARLFDKAVRGYGLRNDDIADTMAAYWLVSWVIANDAKDFSPAAARAVRDQVKGGISQTSVAAFSLEKKHRLADEAIFNTLIATQAFEYAQSGRISKADYRRLADVTQKVFIGFGADLRQLRLTDAGFAKR